MAKIKPTFLAAGALLTVIVGALLIHGLVRFPPDTTPEGAYMRIAHSISRGKPADSFAYLEEEAQHATFSIADYARRASERISETYPEPQRSEALARYTAIAQCERGAATWALLAEQRGWIRRLRRDLSGAETVEVVDERATIITVHGTRYPFRRRPNGIWGLTIFTVDLTAEAERLARDWARVRQAADDYQRATDQKEAPRPTDGSVP